MVYLIWLRHQFHTRPSWYLSDLSRSKTFLRRVNTPQIITTLSYLFLLRFIPLSYRYLFETRLIFGPVSTCSFLGQPPQFYFRRFLTNLSIRKYTFNLHVCDWSFTEHLKTDKTDKNLPIQKKTLFVLSRDLFRGPVVGLLVPVRLSLFVTVKWVPWGSWRRSGRTPSSSTYKYYCFCIWFICFNDFTEDLQRG